ncbi:MAG: hypothetical protein KF891_06710 [Rhizobacter sp.]|nr:hypothetical protein [Rhizobacter sp.]
MEAPPGALRCCLVSVMGLGRRGPGHRAGLPAAGLPGRGLEPHAARGARCGHLRGPRQLPEFLSQADILVCALPLTDETRGLLNHHTLAQLPRGAFFVNIGRGEQVVEPDLRALLDGGYLAGAALDVFEREPPPPDNWVWSHPQVVATPHIAAQASFDTVAQQCVDALRRARDGLPQPLAVDRQRGY